MSVGIGIIGLSKSGRTTVFNALTGGAVDTGGYTQEGVPHVGTAKVPDPRLKVLSDMFQSQRMVPASTTYIDIGASVKSLVKDKGISGQLLSQLSNVDALINVVRAFTDESVPHPEGSLDIERDIANMDLELTFSDLALLERRLERLEVSLKGAKPAERPRLLGEQELLTRIKVDLEKSVPIRELTLTADEVRTLAGYQFLTAKPLLVVVNIGEDQLPEADSLAARLGARYSRQHSRLITLCGKLEMELAQLDDAAGGALRAEFGLKEPGVARVIRLSYELLGLISFLTAGPDEIKAWSIPVGLSAVKAAGKIHSDIEKGFIRAEVVSYDDLVKCGGLAEARKQGLLCLEGKNYTVQDGDVITFLFNV
ncbi:MAG: redox-regulated ATPase YchF [Chloroflexi bacterium]|nr:redox-regulated ATPase YchF [Chloroflexota bacterium]MBI2980148.1 redox-regulated ATPase YchF [Chloroflexota bacterium]